MTEADLRRVLSSLPLGGLRYFDSVGSTNDQALSWASQGAPDMALVIANEQTRGRGRMGRAWLTPPGSALAFSLVLRPFGLQFDAVSLISGLGALALCDALDQHGVAAQIKWPNDVLAGGRKLAGILVEAVWIGDMVESLVLGMGVNVLPDSAPPDDQVLFPATSVALQGAAVDRWALLRDILAALVRRRTLLGQPEFIDGWARRLAFSGQPVQVWRDPQPPLVGVVRGLDADGSLRLETSPGILQSIRHGEVHLRPVRL